MADYHLRRGEPQAAAESARKVIELDARFLRAHLKYGDALLFQGKAQLARKSYAVLEGSEDPVLRHEGAMRSARSYLLDGPGVSSTLAATNAERGYLAEIEAARKAGRPADQGHALAELCRVQIERNALVDAGRTARTLGDLLQAGADQQLTEDERGRLLAELTTLRALMLVAIGERELAEARASELFGKLKAPVVKQRIEELKGDIAARSGDAKTAAALLSGATRPTMKLALALALSAGKAGEQADPARARAIMEELSKRTLNDLEGALTRGRARAWLKSNPAPPRDREEKREETKKDDGKGTAI
jgi:hypothetical protein